MNLWFTNEHEKTTNLNELKLTPATWVRFSSYEFVVYSFIPVHRDHRVNVSLCTLWFFRCFVQLLRNNLSSSCLLKETIVGLPCGQVYGLSVLKSCFMSFSIWDTEQSAPALRALLHAMLLVTLSKIPVSSFIFPSERISDIISCTICGSSSFPMTMGTAVTANESGPNSDILNPNSSR